MFFGTKCSENPRSDRKFGLCDPTGEARAYSDVANLEHWIATVENPDGKEVRFTAIDNCLPLFKEDTKDMHSSCDGMLTTGNRLFLVELKARKRGDWRSTGIEQLENTIGLLKKHDPNELAKYAVKKAYVCNKLKPRFASIENERNSRFFQTHGFRLDIHATVTI